MPYPKIKDPAITIPIPCKKHREYGGKKAPTSGCPVCEMFYLERRRALADIKAALRLLDRYGALDVYVPQYPGPTLADGLSNMRIMTPYWMLHGRTLVDNTGPRRRQNDGILLYERLRR